MEKKIIAVSDVAAGYYLQAEGAEITAIVAYVFDTLGFEKGDFAKYNKDGADRLNLSLKTMQNRATAARALQGKYALHIARYENGLDAASISDFTHFLRDEMKLAGPFRYHVEDICGFLAGKKPVHIQRQEEKEKAELVRAELARVKKEKSDKELAEKQAREADMSGTKDAEPAPVPESPTTVGKADESENRSPAPAQDIAVPVPVPPFIPAQESIFDHPEFEEMRDMIIEANLAQFVFTIKRSDEDGALVVDGFQNLELEELEILVNSFKATIKARKAEEAKRLKAEELAERILAAA